MKKISTSINFTNLEINTIRIKIKYIAFNTEKNFSHLHRVYKSRKNKWKGKSVNRIQKNKITEINLNKINYNEYKWIKLINQKTENRRVNIKSQGEQ